MSRELPVSLYTAEQVRKLDHVAIHQFGIDGFELMGRAAKVTFDAICHKWHEISSIQVVCGGGNNGGDGYLIAYLAKQNNIPVSAIALKAPSDLKGDARKAWQKCQTSGVEILPYSPGIVFEADLIVDAMLGTGLTKELREPFSTVIEAINQSGRRVCAVDIPSGLCADTGQPLGCALRADLTVSFIGLKQGLFTAQGTEYRGELSFSNLDVPQKVYEEVPDSCQRICWSSLQGSIPSRRKDAHKGDYGHVLLAGGNHGMPGAIIMATEAALFTGAGKVSVATQADHVNAIAIRRPEAMPHGVHDRQTFKHLLTDKNVVVIGPGLGRDDWAYNLLDEALNADCALVLDADALNLLSEHPQLRRQRKFPMILTPHPGEAARLLKTDIKAIQLDRFQAVIECSRQYNAITLLKGAGTLISGGEEISLCAAGNPGMATAGMGDVLSGVIGALLAQNIQPLEATRMAAWLHASAADEIVVRQGEIGLLATQLIPVIRERLNNL